MVESKDTATSEASVEYAIVELMGHRRLAGRISEVERFGAKLLRIDVPQDGSFAEGWITQYYGGGSIYAITPTDEATVLRIVGKRPDVGVYLPPPDSQRAFRHAVDDGDDQPF